MGENEGIEEGRLLSINHAGRYVSRNSKDKSSDEKIKQRKMSSTNNKVANLKSDNKNNPANDPKLIKLPKARVGLLMLFRVFVRIS